MIHPCATCNSLPYSWRRGTILFDCGFNLVQTDLSQQFLTIKLMVLRLTCDCVTAVLDRIACLAKGRRGIVNYHLHLRYSNLTALPPSPSVATSLSIAAATGALVMSNPEGSDILSWSAATSPLRSLFTRTATRAGALNLIQPSTVTVPALWST